SSCAAASRMRSQVSTARDCVGSFLRPSSISTCAGVRSGSSADGFLRGGIGAERGSAASVTSGIRKTLTQNGSDDYRVVIAMFERQRCIAPAALPVALAACSPTAPKAPARSAVELEALRPADARLAGVYERACFLCHARAGSGAPLVGDAAAWAPR